MIALRRPHHLSSVEKALLVALEDCGGEAGSSDLVRLCGFGESAAYKALARLRAYGILKQGHAESRGPSNHRIPTLRCTGAPPLTKGDLRRIVADQAAQIRALKSQLRSEFEVARPAAREA